MKNVTSWDTEPVQAFRKFVSTEAFSKTAQRLPADGILRAVSEQSAKIYIAMFGNIAAWITTEGKTLSTVTQSDLARFVNHVDGGKRVLNSKIGYRYLRLLERCYEYLGVVPNPAKQAIIATNRTKMPKDDPGRALSPAQLQRFFDAPPTDLRRRRRATAFDGWKRRRDRAMQVVIALAGLRVSEAIGLLVHEIGTQAKLDGSVDLKITP